MIESGSTSSDAGTWSRPTADPVEEVHGHLAIGAVEQQDEGDHAQDEADRDDPGRDDADLALLQPGARWPARRRSRRAASSRISVATWAISALHLCELVDRRRGATTKDRHHDPESDGDLGGGDDHHEEDGGLAGDVAPACART